MTDRLREPTDTQRRGFTAAIDQPYSYVRKELSEPDWRRFPGWATVTESEWRPDLVDTQRRWRAIDLLATGVGYFAPATVESGVSAATSGTGSGPYGERGPDP